MSKEKPGKNYGRIDALKIVLFLLVVGILAFITSFPSAERYISIVDIARSQVAKPLLDVKKLSTKSANNVEMVMENKMEAKPMVQKESICDFSAYRTDICVMKGDIRIQGGNLSEVLFAPINPQGVAESDLNQTWTLKPYARKNDERMETIRNVTLKSFQRIENGPKCDVKNAMAAVIFSTEGYVGNYWHDFNDVLVPLFVTTRKFNGDVQLLVTQKKDWFFSKYNPIISRLSKYDVIDYDNEEKTHCYPHAIVSLYQHKDFSMDPLKAPYGLSMVNFTKFMRETYSLERDFAISTRNNILIKPRLLIIGRKHTRVLTNIDKIVSLAEELGFEVIVDDFNWNGRWNVQKVAKIVNTCDVIMGVHGAGLTNIVFLPMNSVVIQIVPLGKLNQLFTTEFGIPARDMNLNYLEYEIVEEESTLIDFYPRDDPIFTDPMSIHKRGWVELDRIYLQEQSVKLDITRFRPVLEKAMEFLTA